LENILKLPESYSITLQKLLTGIEPMKKLLLALGWVSIGLGALIFLSHDGTFTLHGIRITPGLMAIFAAIFLAAGGWFGKSGGAKTE
jgi:hypothetical protein